MRRVAMALFGTVFGTTMLVGLKAHGAADEPGAAYSVAAAQHDPVAGNAAKPVQVREILGPAVEVNWQGRHYGSMQVKIFVTAQHIDDIVTVQHSGRSLTVSTVLRAEALTVQSADVGNVSGATASSDAYKQSLRDAIKRI
jgi:uncharacterized protein with FMN-binding domain